MNNSVKLIFLTIIIYFLMNRLQVFDFIRSKMKGYDIGIIYGVYILLFFLVLYGVTMHIPSRIEGVTNQEMTLDIFVEHLRTMISKFYQCDDNVSLRCKISFLEKKLSGKLKDEVKEDIKNTLRKYKKEETCDIDTKSIMFLLELLTSYSLCDTYVECLSHMKNKIELYYPCIKNNFEPEDQKVIQSFYNQIKDTDESALEKLECDVKGKKEGKEEEKKEEKKEEKEEEKKEEKKEEKEEETVNNTNNISTENTNNLPGTSSTNR